MNNKVVASKIIEEFKNIDIIMPSNKEIIQHLKKQLKEQGIIKQVEILANSKNGAEKVLFISNLLKYITRQYSSKTHVNKFSSDNNKNDNLLEENFLFAGDYNFFSDISNADNEIENSHSHKESIEPTYILSLLAEYSRLTAQLPLHLSIIHKYFEIKVELDLLRKLEIGNLFNDHSMPKDNALRREGALEKDVRYYITLMSSL